MENFKDVTSLCTGDTEDQKVLNFIETADPGHSFAQADGTTLYKIRNEDGDCEVVTEI